MDTVIPGEGAVPAMPAWAELPPGATRGIVVVHEIMGRQPEIDAVATQFARRGFASVAPDLFAEGFVRCVSRAVRQAGTGQGPEHAKIARARRWLVDQGVPEGRIGIIGFCLGGGFALAAGPGYGAVSANYGFVADDAALKEGGPVIGCYGGKDRLMKGQPEKLRERLAALGRPGEVHVFPTVSHSFLTPTTGAMGRVKAVIGYHPGGAVADEAWAKIFAFFEEHLPA